jgi:26S proteasome regulatory subunit N1
MDMKETILGKHHYLLYFLTAAMNPRVLSTVDAELNPVPATCRVGLAVETVGQAGRPKTITGFQTHTTPVLLGTKDRAELAGKEFTCVSSVVEGFVIVEPVPETEMET